MEFVKLGETISNQIKGMWGTEDSDELNGIPVIKTNNMTYEGNIDYSNICYRKIDKKKIGDNFLKEGDLLVEKSGGTKYHSVGYVNYFCGESNKFVCNNFIIGLRPDSNKIISKYLFYIIQFLYNTKQFADCFNQTTGIQNLQVETYLNKNIPLVDKSTQQKIVDVLDNINSLIKTKETELAQLDSLVQSQFAQMFGDPITNSKSLPEEELKKIVTLKAGKAIKTGELVDNKDGYYRCYGGNGLRGFINRYSHEGAFTIVGRQGALAGNVNYVEGKFYATEHAVVLTPINGSNSLWIFYCLKFFNLMRFQTGSAQPGLAVSTIASLKIPLPPIELQNKFASFVQQVDKTKSILNAQILQLKELLNSKMDEYFSC